MNDQPPVDASGEPILRRRVLRVAAVCLVLLLVSTTANAVMDVLSFRYDSSVFARFTAQQQWLDPRISWHNKWKDGDRAKGEAFPLSSTVLVATTDAWHLAKEFMLWPLIVAVVLPFTLALRRHWLWWLGAIVLAKCAYSSTFELLFAWGLVH